MRPVHLGVLLGVVFGLANFVMAWRDPLADDTAGAVLAFYLPMFAAWGIAGFVAARRSGRFFEGVKIGATVALVTFSVYWLANFVRVNVFLDAIRDRPDWQRMVAGYEASGAGNFRAYILKEYFRDAPLKLFVPTMIGVVTGALGGGFAMTTRRLRSARQ